MFTPKSSREKSGLEKAIDALHNDMLAENPNTEAYAAMADNITKLYKLREFDKNPWRPNPDVVLTVAANLAGIAMIVGHEKAHVVTSKALTFVKKLG